MNNVENDDVQEILYDDEYAKKSSIYHRPYPLYRYGDRKRQIASSIPRDRIIQYEEIRKYTKEQQREFFQYIFDTYKGVTLSYLANDIFNIPKSTLHGRLHYLGINAHRPTKMQYTYQKISQEKFEADFGIIISKHIPHQCIKYSVFLKYSLEQQKNFLEYIFITYPSIPAKYVATELFGVGYATLYKKLRKLDIYLPDGRTIEFKDKVLDKQRFISDFGIKKRKEIAVTQNNTDDNIALEEEENTSIDSSSDVVEESQAVQLSIPEEMAVPISESELVEDSSSNNIDENASIRQDNYSVQYHVIELTCNTNDNLSQIVQSHGFNGTVRIKIEQL